MTPGQARAIAPHRPSVAASALLALMLAGWLVMLLHSAWTTQRDAERLASARALVQALDLTDMAWFTEARYTRHPALADLHSAFQDGPGSLEHFPSGAWMPSPHRVLATGRKAEPPVPGAVPGTPR